MSKRDISKLHKLLLFKKAQHIVVDMMIFFIIKMPKVFLFLFENVCCGAH